jgi:hypothetical protein
MGASQEYSGAGWWPLGPGEMTGTVQVGSMRVHASLSTCHGDLCSSMHVLTHRVIATASSDEGHAIPWSLQLVKDGDASRPVMFWELVSEDGSLPGLLAALKRKRKKMWATRRVVVGDHSSEAMRVSAGCTSQHATCTQ